ncbi:hypothetical protein [Methylobacterium frigidaeris]|uniref:Uncharacterized protein n=1 Tax=Methylobacterium frigidaeris TaxID=2038277 RepID=A0AA37HHZ1_9HYPH|nr:hypothetical protein [Methylobacterium frigidaeris]PIK72671.1 hypothetical protein CS379_12680 [Methylobacterium frigidaeris]GJD66228.1 hypothetical protein MPEAHAMD_6425 [Methylobacterium frigidaeris]
MAKEEPNTYLDLWVDTAHGRRATYVGLGYITGSVDGRITIGHDCCSPGELRALISWIRQDLDKIEAKVDKHFDEVMRNKRDAQT